MAVSEEVVQSTDTAAESAATSAIGSQRRNAQGMVRLLSLSGVAMALALPIGIYPRFLQSQELNLNHAQTASAASSTTEQEKATTSSASVSVPASVSVATPISAPALRRISLPGSVEALQETGIYARADGYIKERYADIGDRVKAGQILADIETPEVDQSVKEARALVLTQVASKAQMQANLDKARADLDTAMADLAQARANLIERRSNENFAAISNQRWRGLAQQGAVSSHEADEKENAYKISKAATQAAEDKIRSGQSQVKAARARVLAEAASVDVGDANIDAARARQDRTNTQQAFNKIAAPFSGVVTERNIDPGMLITAGSENSKQALYRIARIDTVKVFVDVPQYASSAVRVGQTVAVSLKEYAGRTFEGRILRTSVALDSTARTLKTEIHINNKDLLLTPGMYVDVKFDLPRQGRTFLIPTNALVIRGEGTQLVVADLGKIEYRAVQVGDDLGKQIEIVTGLKGNEQVVVNPSDALEKGASVTIDK